MELLQSIRYPDCEHICSNSFALSFNNAAGPEVEHASISSDDEEFFDAWSMDGDNDEDHASGFVASEVVGDEVVSDEVVDGEVVQSEAVHSEEDQVMASK